MRVQGKLMEINGQHYRSIWLESTNPPTVGIVDQRWLPHEFREAKLHTWEDGAMAIREMWVRGAPLIGVTAAFSLWLAACAGEDLMQIAAGLRNTRPTAVNLQWAIQQQLNRMQQIKGQEVASELLQGAEEMADTDIAVNRSIGQYGLPLLREIHTQTNRPVQILTHCNAGWLATVDYGTATSPIYQAHEAGIPVHVWVSETRPRNQGFSITAWELQAAGIPHTLIVDNASGILMQQGKVDIALVGTDRTAGNGDVANKIGTYLKALAARDNEIPFYVAAPTSSIDISLQSGSDIPIEERDEDEVTHTTGLADNELVRVRLAPANSPAYNPGFDVTPGSLITGLITEKGIVPASPEGIESLKLS